MASFPLDYSTASDAMKRARDNRDPMRALDLLRDLLIFGQLRAWKVDRHRNLSECASDMWKDRRNNDLLIEPDELRVETVDSDIRIFFLTSDLDNVLPTLSQQIERDRNVSEAPAASAELEPKAKGGRPQKHDWDSIWVEMCAYIDREGAPDTYAALVKHILDWLGERAPAQSAIHEKAKPVIDRIRRDQGLPPIT
jgi:hypothetical protein